MPRLTPLKSDTLAPLMHTTGLFELSNVSALVPHRVSVTSVLDWSTRATSRLVNSFCVLELTIVMQSVLDLQMPMMSMIESLATSPRSPISGVIIPFFAGIGIGIGIRNHLDSKSGFGSSSGTITPL